MLPISGVQVTNSTCVVHAHMTVWNAISASLAVLSGHMLHISGVPVTNGTCMMHVHMTVWSVILASLALLSGHMLHISGVQDTVLCMFTWNTCLSVYSTQTGTQVSQIYVLAANSGLTGFEHD